MQTRSQSKSSSSFSSMPSEPIPIANISEEVIIEESFPSQIAQEAKVEVEPDVVDKVEDKSTSIPIDELVSALRSFRKPSKSDTVGKLREPEPFTGKDPKKLKPFLFQCRLYFQGSSDFDNDTKKVTLPCPISGMWLKSGLNPDFLASPRYLSVVA